MAKAIKKGNKIRRNDPLVIHGSFDDVITASVSNITPKQTTAPTTPTKKVSKSAKKGNK